MIEHARGDDEAAQADLALALKINPHFHVLYAEQARQTLDEIARNRQMRASHEIQLDASWADEYLSRCFWS